MSESAVVSACIKWLWLHGCFVWRNNTGNHKHSYKRKDGSFGESYIRYGRVGSADIIGTNPYGRFLSIECKFGKNNLSPYQQAFRTDVLLHNGIYIVARSVDDLEDNKAEILSEKLPTRYADGSVTIQRVKPTSKGQRVDA